MADAYLVSAVRTPIGIGKPESGALWPYQPVDLAAAVLSEAALRAGAPMDAVEDVILGCVTPIGDQGGNIARLAALQAGFPPATPAVSSIACAVPGSRPCTSPHRRFWLATWTSCSPVGSR